MATAQEYTIAANAIVADANVQLEKLLSTLGGFQAAMVREYITPTRISAAAGEAAKVGIDAVDAFRAEKQAHAASFHAALSKK